MRGMASVISRSKNSHMRSPRRVTLTPMALPSRSLKPAIDFLALVTSGFWRGLQGCRSSHVPLALPADPDLLAAVVDAVAGPDRPAGAADQGDVGDVDRHVLVDDGALHRRPGRALVLLGDVDAFDDDLVLVGEDAHDHAVLAEILPGDHPDAVAFLELHDCCPDI